MEIELTCKITAQQLMLTRLIVVLAGNMVFVILLYAIGIWRKRKFHLMEWRRSVVYPTDDCGRG